MGQELMDIDRHGLCNDARRFLEQFDNQNDKFKVGETITFMTGFNDNIPAKATIKAIDGNDIYVYCDCYWFPIQDDQRRKIRKI